VAVTTARMKGWQTRTFLEKPYVHHRQMNTATYHPLLVPLNGGRGDYILGSHPLWETVRCIYQMTRPPILLAGTLRLAGFSWALLTRAEKAVPADFVKFRRAEQMGRLRLFMKTLIWTRWLPRRRDLGQP
jgi:hypothetical protein